MADDNKDTAPASAAKPELAVDSHATASAASDAEDQPVGSAPAVAAGDKPIEKINDAADADVEMKDADKGPAEGATIETTQEQASDEAAPASGAVDSAAPADSSAGAAKPRAPPKRKSTGVPEHKGKKLNRKASKAQILHTDAKPGDHFFIKLKGYPQWPCIICDESMLPKTLLDTRPVGAARADGTYRDDFADGGKKVADRVFPIMYLSTNEFGWVPNKDLINLDPETVMDQVTPKMRKDLTDAHRLASEKNDIEFYQGQLAQFQEELIAYQEAEEARKAAAEEAKEKAAAKKAKKAKDDEDVDMEDADGAAAPKQSKKRKATDGETPQRSDSVKKTKIKLTNNSAPKGVNGSTTKNGKADGAAKAMKSEAGAEVAKAPELSEEEQHARKQKEVLFLRHKLQKGLLTRDQEPKEEEMKTMSEYVTKLETFPDLEVSIIRTTKINKVLKAILKLEAIPKEDEFKFKDRSQKLLEKWNKILATDDGPGSAGQAATTNGVNGDAEHKEDGQADKPKVEKNEDETPKEEEKEATKREDKEAPNMPRETVKAPEKPEVDAKEAEKKAEDGTMAVPAGETGTEEAR